ncbi:Dabb family protein [Actinomycetospora aeridis]|uniref:Dabb family protein n=1 Tax=Actinomycetospora aeridis TaxID=3129231 RepID=A0ABU8N3K7_9PSEU
MIRNVVVGRVREGVPAEQVEAAIQALRDLTVEGVEFRLVGGQDRGLREGNAHFALTADFVSEEAYRIYDADPEHNRIRRELFAPIAASIDRIQFALPDGG